jgi:hypothetical protein
MVIQESLVRISAARVVVRMKRRGRRPDHGGTVG